MVTLYLGYTILLEKIDDIESGFKDTPEVSRLYYYETVNVFCTFILFIWTMQRMWTCYSTRNKTQMEQIKAVHS